MSADLRPLVILDTGVFISDALGANRGASSQVLALAASGTCVPVLSADLWDEVQEKLVDKGEMSLAEIAERYGGIVVAAIWVEPVRETQEHLQFVGGDADDTVLPRMAEAVYGAAPEQSATEHKYIVSLNRKHVRPGSAWAGFLCVTPHGLITRLTDED